jgi:hypothetical protein
MTPSHENSKLRRLPPIFSVNIARFSLLCPTRRGCFPTVEIPPRTNYDIAAIVFRKKERRYSIRNTAAFCDHALMLLGVMGLFPAPSGHTRGTLEI